MKTVHPFTYMITADNRTKETQDFFNEMLEEHGGFSPASRCDMDNFIDEHGEDNFREYFEDYIRMIDQYDEETVEAFLGADFDIQDISKLEDAYYGQYDSEEEFAESFVSECYGLPDMPSWIAIDWKETWEDGLSWDYTFYDGYVFCNHY